MKAKGAGIYLGLFAAQEYKCTNSQTIDKVFQLEILEKLSWFGGSFWSINS